MRRLAERILLLDGWRRALAAFFAGAVATLGLAPVNVPAAGFLSFPVLVWLLDGAAGEPGRSALRRLAPAFRVGWCFGFGYFVAGLWWLGAAILVDGTDFLWALPFAVLGLPAILGLYHGLAAALARSLWSDGAGRLFALAAAFALFEALRGVLFTGFPWNEIGVLAAPVPLAMQSAALAGVHGLTLAAVFVFALPALVLGRAGRGNRFAAALGIVLTLGHLGYGALRLEQAEEGFVPDIDVRIVQPNILQSQKWDAAEAERIFATLLRLTQTRDAPVAGRTGGEGPGGEGEETKVRRTLVVWPESSFPFLLTDRPDAVARLADALEPGETLLAGAARVEEGPSEPRFYNAVYAIGDDGAILGAVDKAHLVPFGEYLPFQGLLEGLGVTQLTQLPGGFSAGSGSRRLPVEGLPPMLALVCYEIIFGEEVAAAERGETSRPAFILNVTNDAWYGQTPGPYQHLRQAELTAVALGLPLVRAANTGVSVVTDAVGRVVDGLALGREGIVAAALPAAGPATLFARFADRPFWCALALTFGVAGIGALRARRVR